MIGWFGRCLGEVAVSRQPRRNERQQLPVKVGFQTTLPLAYTLINGSKIQDHIFQQCINQQCIKQCARMASSDSLTKGPERQESRQLPWL